MFHVIKHGLARELSASAVMWLAHHGYWDGEGDTRNLPDRLERAYARYRLWCTVEGKTTSLKRFSIANFYATKGRFPILGGKGSDTTLVLMFVQWFLRLQFQGDVQANRNVLMAMLQSAEGFLTYMGICHSHDMWLPPLCAIVAMQQGLRALRGYAFCARACMNMATPKRLFGMRPKFDSLVHCVFEFRRVLRLCHKHILNPCIWNYEANEDWIGRASRISRRVANRQCMLRTI